MTSLANRPTPRPMRMLVDGLTLTVGPAGSTDGYKIFLEPAMARRVGIGLIEAADRVEAAAAPVLAELAALLDGSSQDLRGDDA